MSRYRRYLVPGGAHFFTVNLADRRSRLLVEHIDRLRAASLSNDGGVCVAGPPAHDRVGTLRFAHPTFYFTGIALQVNSEVILRIFAASR